jgi:hypothetical protein
MQDNKSVTFGWPIGQNGPIEVQEQLASSHWLPYRNEQTYRRQYQNGQRGPEKDQICAGVGKLREK